MFLSSEPFCDRHTDRKMADKKCWPHFGWFHPLIINSLGVRILSEVKTARSEQQQT